VRRSRPPPPRRVGHPKGSSRTDIGRRSASYPRISAAIRSESTRPGGRRGPSVRSRPGTDRSRRLRRPAGGRRLQLQRIDLRASRIRLRSSERVPVVQEELQLHRLEIIDGRSPDQLGSGGALLRKRSLYLAEIPSNELRREILPRVPARHCRRSDSHRLYPFARTLPARWLRKKAYARHRRWPKARNRWSLDMARKWLMRKTALRFINSW
jgi:hypothetical protein